MSIRRKDLLIIKIKIIFAVDLITTLFYNEKNLYISCIDDYDIICICTDKKSLYSR